MANRGRVVWNDRQLRTVIARAPFLADRALAAIVARHAARGEASMKMNAPWTDRTGNARSGLTGRPDVDHLKTYAVVLAHTATYGWALELANGGRFRIVEPTLRTEGEKTMQTVSGLFGVMFG